MEVAFNIIIIIIIIIIIDICITDFIVIAYKATHLMSIVQRLCCGVNGLERRLAWNVV